MMMMVNRLFRDLRYSSYLWSLQIFLESMRAAEWDEIHFLWIEDEVERVISFTAISHYRFNTFPRIVWMGIYYRGLRGALLHRFDRYTSYLHLVFSRELLRAICSQLNGDWFGNAPRRDRNLCTYSKMSGNLQQSHATDKKWRCDRFASTDERGC